MIVIGLMSGTSLDGIDAAIIETDGDRIMAFGKAISIPYTEEFRQTLRELLGHKPGDLSNIRAVIEDLTERHSDAVEMLISKSGLSRDQIDLIGFHGQTIFHDPARSITSQIGDGALLADKTGIPVINDFRSNDVANGGEGAPLAPVFHVALARTLERPVAFLNIGGVANVTWVSPDGGAIAFDTGPGNALIDDWVMQHTGSAMDENGKIARSGTVNQDVLQSLLSHSYFTTPYPKSLDRDEFDIGKVRDLSVGDGAATLSEFTASSVALAAGMLPARPLRWLACGGGRKNPVLMSRLRFHLGVPVEPVESEGWDGDALEAQAFGFLAARSANAMPLSFPQTTGVSHPVTGGVKHLPSTSAD